MAYGMDYGLIVTKFTNCFSELRNKLEHAGYKDEGHVIPQLKVLRERSKGTYLLEMKTQSHLIDRTAKKILRIVYGSNNEHKPSGFYSKGANDRVARSYLH